MSYTYTQIQARVADELNRSDLTAQIQKAIISAIQHYNADRRWFSEQRATAVTTASQSYVTCPTDMVIEDDISITVGGRDYGLRKITYDTYITESQIVSTGQPRDYAYYQDVFFLWPTPNSAYTLTISYFKVLAELSAGSDTDGWTNFAEEMIRARAKADVQMNVIHEDAALIEAHSLVRTGCYSAREYSARIAFDAKNDQRLMRGFAQAVYL